MTGVPNPRQTIENLWDRACPVGPLLDAHEREIREQVAREIEAESEKTADEDNDPGAKARSFGLYIAARIARTGTKDA